MSTRRGGVSATPLDMNLSYRVNDNPANVLENRRRFFTALGLDPARAAIPLQCHSDRIEVVSTPGEYQNCDALITNTVNLPLVVTVADCAAIVLFDRVRHVLGVVHAGWRGTAKTIVALTLSRMREKFSASVKDVVAYISPSAGQCCYEVGPEVAAEFDHEYVQQRGDRLFIDLKQANVHQLLAGGVVKGNIEVAPQCTICNAQLFHSFRRDGERSGRMMAVATLVGP
jgi:YfiH family protein